MRRSSLRCGVAHKGAAKLIRVRRSSLGCGAAYLVVRRLAVRQARVRFSARHPMEVSLAERRSDKDTRRQAPANGEG